jgi:aspartyl protease family protein
MMLAAVCLLAAGTCRADTQVMVISLSPDHADLMINGVILRRMHAGQTSPDGIHLISATRESAEIEVDGKRLTLRMGQMAGASVSIEANRHGQFLTTAQINGVPVQALMDTGASDVTINSADAKHMGVDYTRGRRIIMSTANGQCPGWHVTLASVQVGNIVLHNVPGSVVEGGPEKLRQALIGMTFLNQVDMQRTGSTMVLTKKQ